MWRCNGGFSFVSPFASSSFRFLASPVRTSMSIGTKSSFARSFSSAIATTVTRSVRRRPSPRQLSWFCQFRMASTLPKFPLFDAISKHDPESTAVVHCLSGRSFRYGELLPDVARTRDRIYEAAGKSDIQGERVAFLVENSYDYVGTSPEPVHLRPTANMESSNALGDSRSSRDCSAAFSPIPARRTPVHPGTFGSTAAPTLATICLQGAGSPLGTISESLAECRTSPAPETI